MKFLITTLFILSASMSFAGTAMNMEGSCTGKLDETSSVSFTYYSNFDGCKAKSSAAVSFDSENVVGAKLITGEREFVGDTDTYTFTSKVRLTFANMTGESKGEMRFKNPRTGKYKTVALTCEIRGYEYAGCE